MVGDKYYKKSNLVESVLIQNTKLLLWEIVNITDTGNGFITCDLEANDGDRKLTTTRNYENLANWYVKYDDLIEIMDIIAEVQDGVMGNIEKIKVQIFNDI